MSETEEEKPVTLSIVVPVHNEAGNLDALIERLNAVLAEIGETHEIILVDDGSTDSSPDELAKHHLSDPRIKVIEFSRNFGKEVALTAGIQRASGQAVITMDADLQHPPETIGEFVTHWRAGHEVVYGIKSKRQGESVARRFYSRIYFWIFNAVADIKLPQSPSDFCLLDRKAVAALNRLPERARFMKGLFRWIGFKQIEVEYEVGPRRGGSGGLGGLKLVALGVDALIAFSALPLRIWFYVGLVLSTVTFAYGSFIIIWTLVSGAAIPGYATLITVILFFGGMQLLTLGIMGAYLERVFSEVKNRPLYIVRQTLGLDDAPKDE